MNINMLHGWSTEWEMPFNTDMCEASVSSKGPIQSMPLAASPRMHPETSQTSSSKTNHIQNKQFLKWLKGS